MNSSEVETLIHHWGSEPAHRSRPILVNRWSGLREGCSSSSVAPRVLSANPGLAWAFANRIVEFGRTNPLAKKNGSFHWIFAAVALLVAEQRGGKPPAESIPVAWARDLDGSPMMGPVLKAALMAVDATVELVATGLKLPVEVVAAYQELFFNVIDRKDDFDYIRSIVEGDESPSMAFALGQAGLSAVDPLLLIGRNGTVEDVLIAAGLGKVEERPSSEISETLRHRAVSAAAAWFIQPGNLLKAPPALVMLGLDLVKRTGLTTEPAAGNPYEGMGKAFREQLECDAAMLRAHIDAQTIELAKQSN